MPQPLISIIVPVYNGETFIVAAIESLLRQEYSNLEIIVVDDGSVDNTQKNLNEYIAMRGQGTPPITILTQQNQGQAAARNVGIKYATGSIIGFLDADDLWSHHHIDTLLPPLLTDDSLMISRGQTRFIKSLDGCATQTTDQLFAFALVGSALFRRSVFDRVGYFDETMQQGEDLDWNIRFSESGLTETRTDETVLFYRRHANNITNNLDASKQGNLHAFRNKLKRQHCA